MINAFLMSVLRIWPSLLLYQSSRENEISRYENHIYIFNTWCHVLQLRNTGTCSSYLYPCALSLSLLWTRKEGYLKMTEIFIFMSLIKQLHVSYSNMNQSSFFTWIYMNRFSEASTLLIINTKNEKSLKTRIL